MNDILDLPGYTIIDRQETEHDIRFTVEYGPENLLCNRCGVIETPYRHGYITQLVMDMPIRGKRVGLSVKTRRYKCKHCGKTSLQAIGFVDVKRFATLRLIEYIKTHRYFRLLKSSFYIICCANAYYQ